MAKQQGHGHKGMELRTKYLVLLMLAEGPKTGYEILKSIRALLPKIGRGVSPGTLYPLLKNLEDEGCIESIEETRGKRGRKVYRLTKKGVETLLSMVLNGLSLVETILKLHLKAAERLTPSSVSSTTILEEIATRLKTVEELTRRLREKVENLISISKTVHLQPAAAATFEQTG